MRISPVNSNYNSFKGIIATNNFVPKKIFAEKQEVVQALSDAKKLDVWTLSQSTGGFINPKVRYLVILKDPKTDFHKQIEADDKPEEVKELATKVEHALILYQAPSNITAIDELKKSEAAKKDPKYVKQLSDCMMQIATSREANLWETKIKML